MKEGSRFFVFEDASFGDESDKVLIVGLIARKDLIEGLISFYVKKDGDDITEKLIRKVKESRFSEQVKFVVTNGIAVAGLNIIDIERVSKQLKVGVAAITRKKPHPSQLKRAVLRTDNAKEKRKVIDRLSKVFEIYRINGYYSQTIGISKSDLNLFIGDAVKYLRLAHIIASGISKGESKGRI